MNEIIEKIIDILMEVKENPGSEGQFTGDSKIIGDIGLDSLEIINFVLRIEEEFDFEIDFDEFDFSIMEDVKTFAAFIESLTKSQSLDGVLV